MPKIKTVKAISKRFVFKKKKLKQRKAGQDHFNSKESGNITRMKRKDIDTTKTFSKTIRDLAPYN